MKHIKAFLMGLPFLALALLFIYMLAKYQTAIILLAVVGILAASTYAAGWALIDYLEQRGWWGR